MTSKAPIFSQIVSNQIVGRGPVIGANGKQVAGSHRGVDLAVAEGTEVYAAANGIVVFSDFRTDYGNVVVIRHDLPSGKTVLSLYAHMKEMPNVKVGTLVTPDTVLGLSGHTGKVFGTTGNHVHFEMVQPAAGQSFDKPGTLSNYFSYPLLDPKENPYGLLTWDPTRLDRAELTKAERQTQLRLNDAEFEAFKTELASIETKGKSLEASYLTTSESGEYLGRYQLGKSTGMVEAGYRDKSGNWTDYAKARGISSEKDFLNSPAAQDDALRRLSDRNAEFAVRNDLDLYIGDLIGGKALTGAGLLLGAHNSRGNLKDYIESQGEIDGVDGNKFGISNYVALGEKVQSAEPASSVSAPSSHGHWEDRTAYDVLSGLAIGPESSVWVRDGSGSNISIAPGNVTTSSSKSPIETATNEAASTRQINVVPSAMDEPLTFDLGNGRLVRTGDDINGADGRLVSFNQSTNTLVVDMKVGDNLYERRTYSGFGEVQTRTWEYAKDQMDASTGEPAQYFNGDVYKIAGDQYIYVTRRGLVHAGTGELAASPEEIARFINQATTYNATPVGYQIVVVDGRTYNLTDSGTVFRQLPDHPGWTESRDSSGGGLIFDSYGNAVAELQPGDKVGQMDDGRLIIHDALGMPVNRTVDERYVSLLVAPPINNTSLRIADVQTAALAGELVGNITVGAYNAGQLAGFDVLPLNENTSFLVNPDGDIAGEITRLPNGYYQVKDLSGDAIYVNGKDGSVVASDTYNQAQSTVQASQTASALGLMNNIISLQHWEAMSDLQRTAALASLYNAADKITGNALPGDLGTIAGTLGLLNALDKGDLGSIAYSGLSLVENLTQTVNAAGQVVEAGWVSANLPGGDSFLPGLGLVLAIDSGDPVNIASSGLSLMSSLGWIGPWGTGAGVALSLLSSMGIFGDEPDIPTREGLAHAQWDVTGNTLIITDQDIEGGGPTATNWMTSLVTGLQTQLAGMRDASDSPYALVPDLLPAVGFRYDPDGLNLGNGARGFMYLQWTDDSGQTQTRYYDGAGSRGDGTGETLAGDFLQHAARAIAPAWQVQTVLAHYQQGQGINLPDAGDSLPQELADGLRQTLQALTLALPVESALQTALIDIDGDGYLERTQWLAANQQVLGIDTDGDGLIGTSELLTLSSPSTLSSLNWLDANGDHILNASDPAFPALRLWIDVNSDANSSGETQTMTQAGIVAIDFGSNPPAIVRADGSRTSLTAQTLTGDVLGVKYQAVVGGVLQLDEQQTGPAVAILHAVNTREFDGKADHVHGGDAAVGDETSGESTVDAGDSRLVTTTANTIATQTVQTSATLAANDPLLHTGVAGAVLTGQLAGQTPGTARVSSNGIVFVAAGSAGPVAQLRETTQAMVRSAEAGTLMPLMALALGAGATQRSTVATAATPPQASDAPGTSASSSRTETIDWQTWDGSRFSPAPNSYGADAPVSLSTTSSGLSGQTGTPSDEPDSSSTQQEWSPWVGNPQVNGALLTPAFVPPSDDSRGDDTQLEDGRASMPHPSDVVLDFPQTHGEQASSREDAGLRFLETLLLANDSTVNAPVFPNQPSLRISSVFAPVHGSVSLQVNAQGAIEVVFLPEANYHGPASFDYTVTDQYGLTNNARVSLVIAAVNDAPVTQGETASSDEDTTMLFTAASLMINDSDVDTAMDGDVLRITRVGLAQHGQVFLQPDGTVRFRPDADYNGPAQFCYWVGDRDAAEIAAGAGYETRATVNLTVLAINDLPIVTGEVMSSDEDIVLHINPALLLANDSDVDTATTNAQPPQVLGITAVGNAQHGSVMLMPDGTLQFTPELNYFGAAGFSYTVDDSHGGQVQGQVVVNLAPVNDAPDVLGETATFNEDEIQTFTQAQLLANDSDVDNPHSDLRIVSVENATHGTIALNPDGTIRFAPDADYFGPAQFTYTVSDGSGGFTVGLATLDIAAVNDAPRLTGESLALAEDAGARFAFAALLANDADVDNLHTELTITAAANASHGNVQIAAGEIVFTPDLNYNGTASFTYTVSDNVGGTSEATVSLTFSPVNDAPVANSELVWGKRNVSYTLTKAALLANDTDVETPMALQISAISNVQHGTAALNADGSVRFTPDAGYAGRGSFDYTVQDPDGAGSTATAQIDFSRVNINPTATDDSFTGYEDIAFSIAQSQLLVNDTDADNASSDLRVAAVASAQHGTVSLQPDGSVRFVPVADYNGPASFSYLVGDGDGGQTWATAWLTVQAVNDAPVIDEIIYGRPVYGYLPGAVSPEDVAIHDEAQALALASMGSIYSRTFRTSLIDQEGYSVPIYDYAPITPTYYRNGHMRPVLVETLDATYQDPNNYDKWMYPGDGTRPVDDPYRQNGYVVAYDPDGDSSAISFGIASGPQHGHAWVNQYTNLGAPRDIDHTMAPSYAAGQTGAWQYYSQRGDPYSGLDTFRVSVTDANGASTTLTINTQQVGSIAPVVLDLDGDGLRYTSLADSTASFDVDHSGRSQRLAWVAASDGLLVRDIGSDGQINRIDEISFTGYLVGAKTDLEGLLAFDSNGNDLLDAGDDQWKEFGAWQDKNGNGISEAGEFMTLDEIGIAEIGLQSDQQVSHTVPGVTELGQSHLTWVDGHKAVVGDVVLAVDGTTPTHGAATSVVPAPESGVGGALDPVTVFPATLAPEPVPMTPQHMALLMVQVIAGATAEWERMREDRSLDLGGIEIQGPQDAHLALVAAQSEWTQTAQAPFITGYGGA